MTDQNSIPPENHVTSPPTHFTLPPPLDDK